MQETATNEARFVVHTQMDDQTMYNYYRFHLRYRSWTFIPLKLLGILFLAIAVVYPLYAKDAFSPLQLAVLLAESGLFLFSTPLFSRMQLLLSRKDRQSNATLTLTLRDSDRIHWKNTRGAGDLYYGQIDAIFEGSDCIYLYISARLAYILTKQGLSQSQLSELRTFLTERTGKPVLRRGR